VTGNTLDPNAVPYTPDGFRAIGVVPPPSPATLHRWRLKGRFGFRIQTFLRGGRRFTTAVAVEAFFEQVTAAADGDEPPSRTVRRREADVRAAMNRLEAEGL
jgi:hypothetical protein